MALKILLCLFCCAYHSMNVYAQLPEKIEAKSADVYLSFVKNKSLPLDDLDLLNSILNTSNKPGELEEKYFITENAFDSLKAHFQNYQTIIKSISTDSSLVLFNYWYLHYSTTFYEYNKQKFYSVETPKIILFSTSMSCHCTLEMCKNQTVELLDFIRTNNDAYHLWIIDSYEHNELQIEYETLFAPSVVVFDASNNVKTIIEFEEEMIFKLKEYVNNN